jgi:hypothetical protein
VSAEEFVAQYMALVDAYVAMSQEEKEQVSAAFVKDRSRREGWVVRFRGGPQ